MPNYSAKTCKEDMIDSLYEAVKDCGGNPYEIIDPYMTLDTLINTLATNGVRFIYIKESAIGD